MELSEIKQRLPINTVLKHYGLQFDRNRRLRCPFHDDKTPSMQVYPETVSVFDYFFYRITSFYEKVFGDKDRLYGVLILSLLQGQNILAISGLVFILLNRINEYTSLFMVIIGTSVPLLFNAIRYYGMVSLRDLDEQWSEEESIIRRRRTFYFFLYIILSIVSAVILISLSR